ncbi:MAG: hypothetical protein A2070_06975 [Bdellovibrionales bacterium GWC1_52_8]|nr:MAG: hypothetical protein A2070_06975 [Bdellovibrionales bacterium GWC1_52_8]
MGAAAGAASHKKNYSETADAKVLGSVHKSLLSLDVWVRTGALKCKKKAGLPFEKKQTRPSVWIEIAAP